MSEANVHPDGTAPEPLRKRISSATFWSLIMRVIVRVLGVATTLLMARMVSQAELGSYAILMILDSGLLMFTQVGFDTAIVQMPKDPEAYLDTAWTANILRSVVCFVIEIAIAPYWCRFFHIPQYVGALRVLALGPLVLGFHSLSTTVLFRSMRFDRLFYVYASETLVFSLVTIGGCLIHPGIWAIIIGYLSGSFARTIVSYLVWSTRTHLAFDLEKAREMFRYAKWVLFQTGADFALGTVDNAVTGRVIGRESLAQYRWAYNVAMEGPSLLQWIVSSVAFPTFSKIQVHPESVRHNFRALLGMVALTMVPASLALASCSEPLMCMVLGRTWIPAAVPLRILTLAALLRSIVEVAPPILRGLGDSRSDFFLKIAQVVVMCALLYPAARMFGIGGISWAVVIGAIAVLPLWVVMLVKTARLSASDFLEPIATPFIAGSIVSAVLLMLPPASLTWWALLSRGALIFASYAALSAALFKLLPHSGAGAVLHGMGK